MTHRGIHFQPRKASQKNTLRPCSLSIRVPIIDIFSVVDKARYRDRVTKFMMNISYLNPRELDNTPRDVASVINRSTRRLPWATK